MISTAPIVPAGSISSDAISLAELRAKHGEGNVTPQETKDDVPTFWVPAEKLRDVMRYLKTEIDRPYPLLYDITAIDDLFPGGARGVGKLVGPHGHEHPRNARPQQLHHGVELGLARAIFDGGLVALHARAASARQHQAVQRWCCGRGHGELRRGARAALRRA